MSNEDEAKKKSHQQLEDLKRINRILTKRNEKLAKKSKTITDKFAEDVKKISDKFRELTDALAKLMKRKK